MKYEQLWKDIETLCALRGPSGREAAVREYLIEQIKGHAEYEVDPLGNLLVRKKGKKPAKKVLQLSAHMDEVGFIITNIDEKGFLSFAPVGGIQPEVTGGRMVLVGDDAIPGMVGCKPVHLCDDKERSDPGKISNMKIDIGAKDKAEAEKLVRDARLLEEAGCFAVVLEKIPAVLAERVSKELSIPTIGIGAGGGTDGQVLVIHDMLGINKGFSPRFLRRYADLHTVMTDAVGRYVADVKSQDFPNEQEQY